MRTANPALRPEIFTQRGDVSYGTMTVEGTVMKTGLMLLMVLLTAGFTWMKFFQSGGNPAAVSGWMMLGLFGGFISALVTIFKAEWSGITAPVYALFEGLFLGGISSVFEAQYPGIVIQATTLTFGTLAAMLIAYQSGLIRATEKFKLGVLAATGGIALVYFTSIILSFFSVSVPFIHGAGAFGIGFSVFVCVIAALNFVIDFDFIERGASSGAPKYLEWYGAFALMVTLVWLYIEFLRLLSKLRQR